MKIFACIIFVAMATILGAGSAGLFFLQQLKRVGFKKIVICDLEPGRLKVAESLGATTTVLGPGESVVDATLFAVEELNQQGGVHGRRVEVHVADGQSDERVFAREAERLITAHGVRTLFGCWTSASRIWIAG